MQLPDPERTPLIPAWPDAGEWLGLGRTATFDAVKRGEIPTIKLGRRLLVPVADLRRLAHLDPTPAPVDELASRRAG